MAKIKVAVIFGGISKEHNLSLATAKDVIMSIPSDKYEVICIGITKKGRWLYYPGDVEAIASGKWEYNPDCTSAIISPDPIHKGIITIENGEVSIKKIDVVFPLLQGKFGADGSIQGLLDMAGIPYVGCGLLSAASCMDKSQTHLLVDGGQYPISTAKWTMITYRELNHIDERCEAICRDFAELFPLIVKPANSGSSIGVTKVNTPQELEPAVKIAFSHDNKVVVEEFIEGKELEVAVFGYDTPFASNVGEIIADCGRDCPREHFVSHSGCLRIPAELSQEETSEIRNMAIEAYKALNCKGFARIDFMLGKNGAKLNKISTAPGLGADCIYPQLMKELGMELSYLLDKLIEQAIENADRTY